MNSLSDTCRDKAPTVSSSPFFYTLFQACHAAPNKQFEGLYLAPASNGVEHS